MQHRVRPDSNLNIVLILSSVTFPYEHLMPISYCVNLYICQKVL